MQSCSYESILRAVGRVLDTAGTRSFSVREFEDGLKVETFGEDGEQQLALTLGLAELTELLEWSARAEETPHYERAYASNEGTLHQFLARHDLVGTR
jgi:hypothetical protein